MNNSRRRFFTGLMKAAAIVALAPQLAFRAKPVYGTAEFDKLYRWSASEYSGEWRWVLNPAYAAAKDLPIASEGMRTIVFKRTDIKYWFQLEEV
jgi:hypothetical protein